ncbi:MAG TPA: type II toxin-antitoxin system VapB family antitoxin [Thermoanaerobaculia bacterium]
MNIIVDEDLLEDARRYTGERTYSGAINKVLAEYVRVDTLRRGIAEMRELRGEGMVPGYLKHIRPNAYRTSQQVAANEVRAPRKKSARRGAR